MTSTILCFNVLVLMNFSKVKCKILLPERGSSTWDDHLHSSSTEKALGFLVDTKLTMFLQQGQQYPRLQKTW